MINAVCTCTETTSLALKEYTNNIRIPSTQTTHLTSAHLKNLYTMPQSRAAAEKEVASWGFSHIFTWTDGP